MGFQNVDYDDEEEYVEEEEEDENNEDAEEEVEYEEDEEDEEEEDEGYEYVVDDPSNYKNYHDHHPEITYVPKILLFFQFLTLALSHDNDDPERQPTVENIINGMVWRVQDAQPGDSFFFGYSGHGAYVQRYQDVNGFICDDDMHAIMLKNLPEGCTFVSVFDCCHAGSVLDLPYTARLDGNLQLQVVDNKNAGKVDFIRTNTHDAIEAAKQRFGARSDTRGEDCIDGKASGALVWGLLKALEEDPEITYINLLRRTRELLRERGYAQIPQLSTWLPDFFGHSLLHLIS
ncbi:caspase domain-containing protein [Cladochytrium replicatum]|nr:caspase domain-containing protein [Cladochytrium replicatum]